MYLDHIHSLGDPNSSTCQSDNKHFSTLVHSINLPSITNFLVSVNCSQGETLSSLLKLDLRDTDSNYAVDVRDPAVVYINNIEKDRKYSGWPSSVQEMLRPTFPGMLRHIRKNFFHMVRAPRK